MRNFEISIFNLFFLKKLNGMYYYAMDYINAIEGDKQIILNSKYFTKSPKELECFDVKIMGRFEFLIFSVWYRHATWITPTPHPLPWLTHQLVIIHDIFPFLGMIGLLKKKLLKIAYFFNRYTVGIINKSMLLPFITEVYKDSNWLYLPNKVQISNNPRHRPTPAKLINIGLIGADSQKKNYNRLIQILQPDYKYKIYGQNTQYFKNLKNDFLSHDIVLIDSSETSFEEFLLGVDCVISVSTQEGFGRLNIATIQNGVPVILLRSDIATEFYQKLDDANSGITICDQIDDISEILKGHSLGNFTIDQNTIKELNQNFMRGSHSLDMWINKE